MKGINKALMSVCLFAFAGSAAAVPIIGTIRFGGGVTGFDINANTVDITNEQGIVSLPQPGGTFSFESLTSGTIGTYNDFNYNQPITGGSINPLWSVGGFSFELTNITSVDETPANTLQLTGLGQMTFLGANTYDPTAYAWSFSIDSVNNEFTFSSTNLPEPAVALLIGMGLVGFGVSRKMRKSA